MAKSKPQELSLKELFNQLSKQQAVYGNKLERLYDLYSGVLPFPKDVTSSNDSPGLWPDNGMNVYAILPEYNLATTFCTVGILFNIGQGRYKYQIMVVQSDELNPVKNGKMYYRYSKATSNDWSRWQRFVYMYELTGGKDENGNPLLDDFGLPMVDSEGEIPYLNPHNADSAINNLYVAKAERAKHLETPRKIELVGAINGSVMFDGSKDVQLKTDCSDEFFVPLNVRIDEGYRTNDEYHLIATLPANVEGNYDYVMITGHIGGYSKTQGKAWFTACISNSGGIMANGVYLGTIGTNDIVVYRNVTNQLEVYLRLRGWNDDLKFSVYGSKQVEINNVVKSLPRGSTLCWSLKQNSIQFDGKNIYGELIGNADTSSVSDTTKNVNVVSRTKVKPNLYAVGVLEENGTEVLYTDRNIQFLPNSHIKAPVFEGNLTGNATSAKTADVASKVNVVKNTQNYKSYLLGTYTNETITSLPRFDTDIYMKGIPGQLYVKDLEAPTLTSSTSTINNLTVETKLSIPKTSSLYDMSDNTFFNTIKMGASGDSKNAFIEMRKAQLKFGDDTYKVVFNVPSGSNAGVYKESGMGVLNISGALKPTRVYNAIYNDVAELFPCTVKPQAGDVLMLDVNADEETYVLSTEGAKYVAGVVSDSYGYLLGGDEKMSSDELEANFAPIGLAGRVKVNVVGKISKGDKLVATDNGCARAYNPETDDLDSIIGYAVESDNETAKRRLKMKIN